jgi:DNA polymerase-3 subunit delta
MTTFIVNGSDPSLVSRALTDLLTELAGATGDLGEVESHEPSEDSSEGETKGRIDLGPVTAALSTPSWLSPHRIVVVRDAGALSAAQATELAALITSPPLDNHLVLAGGGKAISATLTKAVKAAKGRVIEAEPGRQSRARNDWFDAHVSHSPVHLDAAARRRLSEHIGEDAARLDPILELVAAAYGTGRKVTVEDLEPLLGEAGGAPPWELTDAIAEGDGEKAVRSLRRLLGPGGRHPLQVLATLHRTMSGLLRLDGATDVRTVDDAAAVLQMNAFPARKLFDQARRLGSERIARGLEVVADADADLRGRVAWPAELVMEVAVARLAQLSRSTPASRPAAAGGGGRGGHSGRAAGHSGHPGR